MPDSTAPLDPAPTAANGRDNLQRREEPPERRLHLTLDLHADDLNGVYHALRNIAEQLDHDGREERELTSGGTDSGYHLALRVTDPDMNAGRYTADLMTWMEARRGR